MAARYSTSSSFFSNSLSALRGLLPHQQQQFSLTLTFSSRLSLPHGCPSPIYSLLCLLTFSLKISTVPPRLPGEDELSFQDTHWLLQLWIPHNLSKPVFEWLLFILFWQENKQNPPKPKLHPQPPPPAKLGLSYRSHTLLKEKPQNFCGPDHHCSV